MEIRKIKINNNEYEFVNSSKSNRSGFKHITTLLKNGRDIADYSCQYYNRTWECYQYQSVMQCCVNTLIDKELDNFINDYKYQNNIGRLTRAKREELEKEFNNQENIIELREVYKQLENRQ